MPSIEATSSRLGWLMPRIVPAMSRLPLHAYLSICEAVAQQFVPPMPGGAGERRVVMKLNRMLVYAVIALGLAGAQGAWAKEQFSYSVKFVCGYNPTNVGISLEGKSEGEP